MSLLSNRGWGLPSRCGGTALATILAVGCAQPPEPADTVLHNGKIVTLDAAYPEVQAIAIRAGRVEAVGTDREIQEYIDESTEVIDLQGNLAIPGFIEGHGHFMGIGDAQMILELSTPKTWDEIVAMVAQAAQGAQPGDLIRGRGWHQDKWESPPEPSWEGLPLHDSLSKASPENPVILTHASGHASMVNAKALEMAGIDSKTPDPPGGEILRDRNGRPTGFLRETAQGLVRRATGSGGSDEATDRKKVELASQECLRKGITSFQDAGSSFADVDLFKEMVDEGKLPLRLWVMIRAGNDQLSQNLASYRMIGYGDDRLSVRAIKVSIDGALGSRGAWLLEPYSDAPSLTGLNLVPLDEVRETARLAMEHDYQLCIHAIGDRGNREVLDLFEEAFQAHPDKQDPRWRIEHAQHLHPDDIPRFGQLGVIASMQAVHCTSDGPWVPDRLGDQRSEEGAYVWQKLMRTGALVTNGTDAPVEDVSPIASYYAAVTRRLPDGSSFYPDQRMTRIEALKSYTLNVAHAGFEEDLKGSLSLGKLGDVTVLSKDILTVPDEEILDAEVLFTIVAGRVEYRR